MATELEATSEATEAVVDGRMEAGPTVEAAHQDREAEDQAPEETEDQAEPVARPICRSHQACPLAADQPSQCRLGSSKKRLHVSLSTPTTARKAEEPGEVMYSTSLYPSALTQSRG